MMHKNMISSKKYVSSNTKLNGNGWSVPLNDAKKIMKLIAIYLWIVDISQHILYKCMYSTIIGNQLSGLALGLWCGRPLFASIACHRIIGNGLFM